MRVYHGSLERVPTPEIRQATRTLDYGTGFYTTTSAKQAEDWVRKRMRDSGTGKGYVNDYSGNPVFVAPLVSTPGNCMPINLNLIYNGYQQGAETDRPYTTGKGWRLSIQGIPDV